MDLYFWYANIIELKIPQHNPWSISEKEVSAHCDRSRNQQAYIGTNIYWVPTGFQDLSEYQEWKREQDHSLNLLEAALLGKEEDNKT